MYGSHAMARFLLHGPGQAREPPMRPHLVLVAFAATMAGNGSAVAGDWSSFQSEIEALLIPVRGLNRMPAPQAEQALKAFQAGIAKLSSEMNGRRDPGDGSTKVLQDAFSLARYFAVETTWPNSQRPHSECRVAAEELLYGLHAANSDLPVLLRQKNRLHALHAERGLSFAEGRGLAHVQAKIVMQRLRSRVSGRSRARALFDLAPVQAKPDGR